jgi:hypothetical protein
MNAQPILNTQKQASEKRGRKPGAVSFMQVTLAELNRVLKPDAKVILSLKYGTLVGLDGKAVGGDMTVMEHCVNSGRIDMSVETFDDHDGDADLVPKELPKVKKSGDDGDDDSDGGYIPPLQAELESWED